MIQPCLLKTPIKISQHWTVNANFIIVLPTNCNIEMRSENILPHHQETDAGFSRWEIHFRILH